MLAGESKTRYWSPAEELMNMIQNAGGPVNAHSHMDRAFTITPKTLKMANAPLQEKWDLVDAVKRDAKQDPGMLYTRMAHFVELMIHQGVHTLGSFIDIDPVIGDTAITVARKIQSEFRDDIDIVLINQTLKGVLDPVARQWFDEGSQMVDIIGGLPGKDEGHEREHLEIVLGTAKALGKMAHVHVDQNDRADERETELLVDSTISNEMQGRAVAVHGISIAAQPLEYRQQLYRYMASAGVMAVTCPTAYIDRQSNERVAPTHNSITPTKEMTAAGVKVAIGTDNVQDLYLPDNEGSMREEILLLVRAMRWFDLPPVVQIATENGRAVLGLPPRRQ